jgi:hypothetical protein
MNDIKNASVRQCDGCDRMDIGLEDTCHPIVRPPVYRAKRLRRSQRRILPSKLGEQMPPRRTVELNGCERISLRSNKLRLGSKYTTHY